jgi:hypothetical protein
MNALDTLRRFAGLSPKWKRPDEQAFLEAVFEGLKKGGESVVWQRLVLNSDCGNPADIVLNLPDGGVAVITFDLNGLHFKGPEKGSKYPRLLRGLFWPWWADVEKVNPGVRFRFFLVTDSRCDSMTVLKLHDYGIDVIDNVWSGPSGAEHLVANIKSRLRSTSTRARQNTSTSTVAQEGSHGT